MIQPDIKAFARTKAEKAKQMKILDTTRDVQRESLERQYPKMARQEQNALTFFDAYNGVDNLTYHDISTVCNIGEPASSRVCNTLKRHELIEPIRDENGNIKRYVYCTTYRITQKGIDWLREQGK